MFTAVRFANLEAVPESWEVDDWFREVTLFKVNATLWRDINRNTGADVAEEFLPEFVNAFSVSLWRSPPLWGQITWYPIGQN